MLNKSKPYDTVYGVPGVGFVQNGKSFKPNGEPVVTERKEITSDDGKSTFFMEVAASEEPKKTEPKVEPKPEAKVEAPVEKPIEAPKEVEAEDIPEFIMNPPEGLKYPSQMNKTEMVEELMGRGIEANEDMLAADLRKMVKDSR